MLSCPISSCVSRLCLLDKLSIFLPIFWLSPRWLAPPSTFHQLITCQAGTKIRESSYLLGVAWCVATWPSAGRGRGVNTGHVHLSSFFLYKGCTVLLPNTCLTILCSTLLHLHHDCLWWAGSSLMCAFRLCRSVNHSASVLLLLPHWSNQQIWTGGSKHGHNSDHSWYGKINKKEASWNTIGYMSVCLSDYTSIDLSF